VVNPAANGEFQRQLFRILQARAASGLQERIFNPFGELTIYVEDVSTSQVALRASWSRTSAIRPVAHHLGARGRLLTDEANRRITLRMMNGAVNEATSCPWDVPKRRRSTRPRRPAAPPAPRAIATTRFDIYD
jgi:hypothetical protein